MAMSRQKVFGLIALLLAGLVVVSLMVIKYARHKPPSNKPPNFLLILTDDQSWIHTSYAGYRAVKTPNFDKIAKEGVYFENAYASAPTCTASRSSILAGQHFWRLGSAAQLWGAFPPTLTNYQKILAQHGYKTGYTEKGWGPGMSPDGNPAGQGYNAAKSGADPTLSQMDHVENLRLFLHDRKPDQPFSFWLTPTEPHRPYKQGIGASSGEIDLADIDIPPFMPDDDAVRGDIADYLYEIQYFDHELGGVLALLKQEGVLDNTVIVYAADNGMPFPRAKSNNYEYGTHVPLAVRWGERMEDEPGQRVTDFISLTDLAPTFLDLAGIPIPAEMTGRSFKQQLLAQKSGRIDEQRNAVFSGFERHIGYARPEHRGYPSRAIHTDNQLYIYNFAPDTWPAGVLPNAEDIDNGSPSKVTILSNPEYAKYADMATAKRPQQELYFLKNDAASVENVAGSSEYSAMQTLLSDRLFDELKRTGDPRVTADGDIFNSYRYYAPDSR